MLRLLIFLSISLCILAEKCTYQITESASGSVRNLICTEIQGNEELLTEFYRTSVYFNEGTKFNLNVINSSLDTLNSSLIEALNKVEDYNNNNILDNIEAINMNMCKIKLVQGFFENFSALKTLSIVSANDKLNFFNSNYTFLQQCNKLETLIIEGYDVNNDLVYIFGNLSSTVSSVQMRNCEVKDLSNFSPRNGINIDFSYNKLKSFSHEISSSFSSRFDFSFNDITNVTLTGSGKINNLVLNGNSNLQHFNTNVTILNLGLSNIGNQLNFSTIDFHFISFSLDISGNALEDKDLSAFKNLTLTILDMSNNDISMLPFEKATISKLYLSGNKLKDVSKLCQKVSNLTMLNLANNPIESIDIHTFADCGSLEWLYLNSNNFAFDKDSFNSLPSLKSLSITVSSPFKGISHFSLNMLYLLNSKIELQNESFSKCLNLQFLYFYGCNITNVEPRFLDDLFHLEQLDAQTLFQNVQLEDIQDQKIFQDLNRLSELNLSNVNISELRSDIFVGLNSLKTLYLFANNIELISSDAFLPLTSIASINLHRNYLITLPVDLFSNNTELDELTLSNNLLISLEPGVFSNLKQLTKLDLSDNRLTSISLEVMKPLTSLKTLNLENNKLHTSLQFGDLFQFQNVLSLLTSLSKVGINGNLWNCKELVRIMSSSIDFTPINVNANYNTTNVKGIQCSNMIVHNKFEELILVTQI